MNLSSKNNLGFYSVWKCLKHSGHLLVVKSQTYFTMRRIMANRQYSNMSSSYPGTVLH